MHLPQTHGPTQIADENRVVVPTPTEAGTTTSLETKIIHPNKSSHRTQRLLEDARVKDQEITLKLVESKPSKFIIIMKFFY